MGTVPDATSGVGGEQPNEFAGESFKLWLRQLAERSKQRVFHDRGQGRLSARRRWRGTASVLPSCQRATTCGECELFVQYLVLASITG